MFILTGCSSAKEAISTSSRGIEIRARESQLAAIDIHNLASYALELDSVNGDPNAQDAQRQIVGLSQGIVSNQDDIVNSTATIQSQLHRVEDKTPWWARLGSNLAIAAIVIGIIVLLWQTGIGMIIKKIVWSLGWFIPKNTMRLARADIKVLDNDNEMNYRESIAIRRTVDPAYEAARKKLKREKRP
tara:strand:+ start:1067 stop:1627 length:561 start_codon:yes stop_codon:yes gene_type:complete